MFELFGKSTNKIIEGLVEATQYLDYAILQMFNKINPNLKCNPIQLTYYSMTAVSYAFYGVSKESDNKKVQILDEFSKKMIDDFPSLFGKYYSELNYDKNRSIKEYQNAHAEYTSLFFEIFTNNNSNFSISLIASLWKNLTGNNEKTPVIYSPLLVTFTTDAFKMIKDKI